ncbi:MULTISPECIES: NADPH-dependent FMN reductase [unclassified Streptococcus]|uniref:NADPH-dependent FMN reductase n=1 Tax=unclassified Streptococcus TaxID=2608887 RepID=UPI001072B875|nr:MULTISPECIES: NADPH-dependent FMN reductase [unclassified Streptococcus]MBF0806548.1 NAD(P)H-dependent oxidoreductase [Streptococcus sp. 19428wA2_WM07]TFU27574.1 NAD(P)H-dependent oxidoreductase [Streptococcus sp. WM07]
MKNILFIVGSLREGSFNKQMAETAEKVLEGKANVSYLDWKDVPVFSQELEVPTPAPVAAVRKAIMAADAIWIFSPVYNFSIPGSVKNLLDWASRALDLSDTRGPSALQDKVSTVSLVASAGHEQAAAIYRDLLPFIRTKFVDQITTSPVNDSAWADGKFVASEEVIADLNKQADALLAALNEA